MFSLPVFEYEIKNNNAREKIAALLPNIVDNTNAVVLITHDEEYQQISPDQSFFNVLATHKKKEIYEMIDLLDEQELKLKEKTRQDMELRDLKRKERDVLINLRNPDSVIPDKLNSILYKIHLFGDTNNLTEFEYEKFMELKLLNKTAKYDIKKNFNINYTYIETKELLNKFKSVIIMDSELPYEKQINGKFLKAVREDGVTEFRSKWIYAFNIPSDNYELTIGIQLPSKNFGGINTYIYSGFVILKSNGVKINFVDYLPFKDTRQGFLKMRLNRGSYLVVPL